MQSLLLLTKSNLCTTWFILMFIHYFGKTLLTACTEGHMHTAHALKYLRLVCENNYKKVSIKQCLKLGLLGNTLQGGVSWGVHWSVSVGKWEKRIKQ